MPDPDDRISNLYQASKPRMSPPAELDARILAEAQRQPPRKRSLPLGALGAVATLLIGVGLAWFHIGVPPVLAPAPEQEPAAEAAFPVPAAPSVRMAPSTEEVMKEAPPKPAEQRAFSSAGQMLRQDSEPGTRAKAAASPTLDAAAVQSRIGISPADLCGLDLDNATEAAWRKAIEGARARGDIELATCLADGFRERFDE